MYALLMRACGAGAAMVIGVITLLVSYDVIARNLGFGSLPWVLEATEYALPLATLLAAPWLMYSNQHIRLDLIESLLSGGGKAIVGRIASAIGFVVSAVLSWYAIAALLDAKRAGAVVLKSLVFPEWWLFIPVPFAFALLAVECARRVLSRQADMRHAEGEH